MKAFNLTIKNVLFGQTAGNGLLIGEEGRNRVARKIKCQASIPDGKGCEYKAPKVGFGSIVEKPEAIDGIWLARISTEGAYIRGAAGNLAAQQGSKAVVLVKGEGRFGAAGNTGRWADALLAIPDGEVIRVKPSRGNPYFLVFGQDNVEKFTQDDWLSMGGTVDRSEGWADIPMKDA